MPSTCPTRSFFAERALLPLPVFASPPPTLARLTKISLLSSPPPFNFQLQDASQGEQRYRQCSLQEEVDGTGQGPLEPGRQEEDSTSQPCSSTSLLFSSDLNNFRLNARHCHNVLDPDTFFCCV